jgi:hypothetical protein
MISIGSIVSSQKKTSFNKATYFLENAQIVLREILKSEDEKHFIVDCPLYENIRVKLFDKVIDLCLLCTSWTNEIVLPFKVPQGANNLIQ